MFACAPKTEKEKMPDTILPQQKMVDIIADMHLAEAIVVANPHGGDTNTQKVIDYYGFIYKKHNVSKENFKTSYDYYIHHPVLLDSVYSDVITKLSDKETKMRGK